MSGPTRRSKRSSRCSRSSSGGSDRRRGRSPGGEQQMCAIGRGLMTQPRLLLLDEPALGLSPLLVREVFASLRAIRARGVTIVLVEQNVPHALALADRAYVLETGRVTLTGTASELLADHRVRDGYLGLRVRHDGESLERFLRRSIGLGATAAISRLLRACARAPRIRPSSGAAALHLRRNTTVWSSRYVGRSERARRHARRPRRGLRRDLPRDRRGASSATSRPASSTSRSTRGTRPTRPATSSRTRGRSRC